MTKDNLDNDDYTIMTNLDLKDSEKTAFTTSTNDKTPKYVDTYEVADNAKVLLWSENYKAKYVTGKQFKSILWNATSATVQGTALKNADTDATLALYSKVDGLNKVSYLAVNVGDVQPDEFKTNDNYAVVVSDSYKYDSDYVSFDVFTGTETTTVLQKKSGAKYVKGDIIGYSSITEKKVGDNTVKVIDDVTKYHATNTANSTTAGQYSVGAIQGVNSKGDEITVNGTNTFKITSDTKIFFIDSDAENDKDDYKGVASDATKVDSTYEADEIGDTGMYYYNCAYILDTGLNSDGKADLSVLVIDVKNRMANTAEGSATVSTLTGCTATINGTAVAAGTTLAKGQVMVVTATTNGTLSLTHAKLADGNTSKTNVKSGDVLEVYATGTDAITVSIS